ncbi:hypothetical protein [Chryseobacterium sp. M5A1_1a]
MKTIFIAAFLFPLFFYTQDYKTVLDASKFIGKSFNDFESNLALTPQSIDSKFGLEKRVYKKNSIIYSAEEVKNNEVIDRINIVKMKDPKSHQLWYDLVESINADHNFKFTKAIIAKNNVNVSEKELSYSEMISFLRSAGNTDDLSYLIDYKLGDTYYTFAVIDNSLFITLGISE